jgi:hypothetical protein
LITMHLALQEGSSAGQASRQAAWEDCAGVNETTVRIKLEVAEVAASVAEAGADAEPEDEEDAGAGVVVD